jgi:hypothetical protein
MAAQKGINSYVSLDEADSYFEGHVSGSQWSALDALAKARLLVTSTRVLDDLSWAGAAVSSSQPLAFPRVLSYFDPRLGQVVEASEIPVRVCNATFEMALHLLNNEGILAETGSFQSLSVGPVNLTEMKSAPKIPANVRLTVSPLLANRGANMWWRAN